MIGIIGYGMVGKAVSYGFGSVEQIISDPKFNSTTVADVVASSPMVIFVCVPTPSDGSDFSLLTGILDEITRYKYSGMIVVKSTVLPKYLDAYDIIYNPEFLSRATSFNDFVNPPMVIIGGNRSDELLNFYREYSMVNLDKVFVTDVKTASLAKYCMNSFYATKVTFMNQMYDIAIESDVEWDGLVSILENHPWMGSHHFSVPGPDGKRGFGGPCLPKDTAALINEFDMPLLERVMEINSEYRK